MLQPSYVRKENKIEVRIGGKTSLLKKFSTSVHELPTSGKDLEVKNNLFAYRSASTPSSCSASEDQAIKSVVSPDSTSPCPPHLRRDPCSEHSRTLLLVDDPILSMGPLTTTTTFWPRAQHSSDTVSGFFPSRLSTASTNRPYSTTLGVSVTFKDDVIISKSIERTHRPSASSTTGMLLTAAHLIASFAIRTASSERPRPE